MAYQKATLHSIQMINKPTFMYVEKPKPTYLSLTLHKAHPSPNPLQNLKNHHKLHHSSILTPPKQPKNHHENTPKTAHPPTLRKKTLLEPPKNQITAYPSAQ